jgi:LysM repeat protein
MWNSSRRIALLSAAVVFIGSGLVGIAWLADVLPIEFGKPAAGELAASGIEAEVDWSEFDDSDPVIHFQRVESRTSLSSANGIVFADQSEPGSRSDIRTVGFETRDRSLLHREPATQHRGGLEAEFDAAAKRESDLPRQFPAVAGSVRPTSSANAPTGRSARSYSDTEPHQVIRQAEYLDESPATDSVRQFRNSEAAPRRLFDETPPATMRQAREFPQGVAVPDRRSPSTENFNASVSSLPPFESSRNPEFGLALQSTADELFAAVTESEAASRNPGNDSSDRDAVASEPDRNSTETTTPQESPVRTATRTEPLPQKPGTENKSVDLAAIDAQIAAGEYVAAHRAMSQVYWNEPESRSLILERLEKNAETIYFNPQPHFLEPYEIQSGDLLQKIAPKYQVSWQYLAALNRISDPRRVRAGQKIKVIKGPFSAFVDLSDFELTIHAHGFFVKRYQVGIGKDGASPTGQLKVLEKIPTPQYTDPDGRVIAGGEPTNPLGPYWVGLGNSYGIHGTIDPDSIGKAESRGCIRMRNEDVAEVYNFLTTGSEVVIRP